MILQLGTNFLLHGAVTSSFGNKFMQTGDVCFILTQRTSKNNSGYYLFCLTSHCLMQSEWINLCKQSFSSYGNGRSELIGEKNKVRPGSEPPFATLFGKVTSLFQEKGKVTSCAKFCLILTVATSPQLCMCAYAIFQPHLFYIYASIPTNNKIKQF